MFATGKNCNVDIFTHISYILFDIFLLILIEAFIKTGSQIFLSQFVGILCLQGVEVWVIKKEEGVNQV